METRKTFDMLTAGLKDSGYKILLKDRGDSPEDARLARQEVLRDETRAKVNRYHKY